MRTSCPPRKPDDRAPAVHIPIRRAEPRKGRHHVHAAVIGQGARDGLRFGSALDDLHLVPQPLNRRAGDEYASFQRVGACSVQPPRNRRNQPVLADGRLIARVHQQKATCSVCVFHHARLKAALTEERAVLIAAERRNGDGAPEDGRIEHADHARCIRHARQHGAGNVQRVEQRVVPIVLADVKEHRPARVGRVRHMRPPADEVPRQKAVHRAEADFPALGALVQPKPIQQPAQLAAGKISVRHEPRHGFDVLFKSFLAESGDNRRGSAALPDNRVVQRPAGFPIPEQRGLALVGDADCRNAVQRNAGNADDLAQRVNLRIEDRRRVVLHPAGLRINLLKFIALHGDDPRAFVEQNGAGAGRPLIERNHIGMHGAKPPVFSYKTRRRRSSPRRRRPSVSYFSSTKYSMPPVVPTTISLP